MAARSRSTESGPKDAPLVSTLDTEQKRVLYDKLGVYEWARTMGFLAFFTSVIIVARWPQYAWIWYISQGFIYLPWRWCRFVQMNKEWYLMDFCYFVPYTMLLGVSIQGISIARGFDTSWTDPYVFNFFRAMFSFCNGALMLSVLLLGNRIVLHDVDSTTGIFIHFAPGVLMWTLRWGGGYGPSIIEEYWGDFFKICPDMQEADISVQEFSAALWYQGTCAGTVRQFAFWPGLTWIIIWGIPYYLIMFVCLKQYFEEHPEKDFNYRDTIKPNEFQGTLVRKLPECLQPLGFMMQHFIWCIIWGYISIAFWNSYILHCTFLTVIFLYALHNGSSFMFREVAAKRIQGKVLQVVAETKGMEPVHSVELERAMSSSVPQDL